MNAEKLMNAIGNISDRHIIEFAVIQQKEYKTLWGKVASIAACFCIILSAILIIPSVLSNVGNPQNPGDTIDPYEIIWGDSSTNENVSDYIDIATVGSVTVVDSLKKSIEDREDDAVLYAVLITETTGKSSEYIYNAFVKPLNVREQYFDHGIIFITESQINALQCPVNMAIILSPALKPTE